jgi:hypothetical protein
MVILVLKDDGTTDGLIIAGDSIGHCAKTNLGNVLCVSDQHPLGKGPNDHLLKSDVSDRAELGLHLPCHGTGESAVHGNSILQWSIILVVEARISMQRV